MAVPRPSFNLGSFLEKDKLKTDGSKFTNWFRTLRILLVPLKMAYVLEGALGDTPADDASQDEKNVYLSKTDDYNLVQSGILYSMEAELQKRFERMGAHEIITNLKTSLHLKPRLNDMRLLKPSSHLRWTSTTA